MKLQIDPHFSPVPLERSSRVALSGNLVGGELHKHWHPKDHWLKPGGSVTEELCSFHSFYYYFFYLQLAIPWKSYEANVLDFSSDLQSNGER